MDALLTFKNAAFRLRRGLGRRLLRFSADPRPISLPFVSGDTFRALADHIYEGDEAAFRPESVKPGDVVFVDVKCIGRYFSALHGRIGARYVLVTHNGDRNVDEALAKLVDDRLVAWFAQNVAVRHEKIFPIPIGLENQHYCNNGLVRVFSSLRKAAPVVKKDRVLFGFNIATNSAERQPAFDALSRSPLAENLQGWPEPPEYAKILRGCKFVASPPGNGLDCHRTWEAMLLRTVPIVKRNFMHEHFLGLGLPLLLVNDWREIQSWDEKFLRDTYGRLEPAFASPYLLFEPWRRMIEEKAAETRKKYGP